MYNDANLPDDEAWQAMSQDLRQTKEAKNNLSRENSCVICISFFNEVSLFLQSTETKVSRDRVGKGGVSNLARFATTLFTDACLQRWGDLLRAHGLIS